jgi:2'-5' RNA ligase
MRCFIAIDIDDNIRAEVGNLQQRLQNKADIKKSDAKWVKPEAMHLTLKFLGEVKDQKVAELCNIVKGVAACHKSFELDIEQLGYFGGKRPKVLWVGTGEGGDDLRCLAKELEQQLALVGWPEDTRDFSGHLTLCRIRNPIAGIELVKISEQYKDLKLGTISADSVSVYQIQLTPTGPIYSLLGNYKLE